MGLFSFMRPKPERELMDAVLKVARDVAAPRIVTQGGGGGSETRWRGASRLLRSMASWLPRLGSPSRDLNTPERKTLVARSRDAMRNHLIARAAIYRARTSIVGTGLICRPQVDWKVLGISEDEAERYNEDLERIWSLYADNPCECDAEATLNHYQLQSLVLISAMVGGDVFVASPDIERPGCVFSTRLQPIETDRVCNPAGQLDTANLTDGVVSDQHGAPVGYWVSRGYPDEVTLGGQQGWDFLPAFGAETGRRRVLHIWADKERPGQKRGAPYLAPVLEPLQKLERYSSAELMAAVISAMFTVFLKKSSGFDGGNLPMSALVGGQSDQIVNSAEPADELPPVELGEGAVVDLGVGEEPVIANPARPNAQFDPFFTAVVKEIGAALEQPMEELLLHYSSSYSAARAAMLQAWRFYLLRRWWLTCDFCQPSRELVVDEAVARGLIRLPGYNDPIKRKAWLNAIWIGPAKGAMDELKEANAAKARIDAGVSNETIETAAMTGESWQSVIRQRSREIKQRRELDLPNAASQPAREPAPQDN